MAVAVNYSFSSTFEGDEAASDVHQTAVIVDPSDQQGQTLTTSNDQAGTSQETEVIVLTELQGASQAIHHGTADDVASSSAEKANGE